MKISSEIRPKRRLCERVRIFKDLSREISARIGPVRAGLTQRLSCRSDEQERVIESRKRKISTYSVTAKKIKSEIIKKKSQKKKKIKIVEVS